MSIGIIIVIILLLIVAFYWAGPSEAFRSRRRIMPDAQPRELRLFYMPGCIHCQRLMDGPDSVWNQIKHKYAARNIIITEFNGERYPDAAQFYGVDGYPTIILLRGSRFMKYRGERTVAGLSEFIESGRW